MRNSYNDELHKWASKKLYEYGRDLRQISTRAENILWEHLRNRRLDGYKFRRQHPLDMFVADFYCHEMKLVIELDGKIHDASMNKDYDRARTVELNSFSITVLRFRNEEVEGDIENVLRRISLLLKEKG